MQGIISFANSSVSSLYGCIGYTVQDMLLHQFPKNYFRSTTMASELATRNMRRLVGLNTNNELQKRQKLPQSSRNPQLNQSKFQRTFRS